MKPAEELRAAAKVLRDTAAKATPGPWQVVIRYRRHHPTVPAGAELLKPGLVSAVSLKYPNSLRDAQWNALVNPALAEPLAAWLDATATAMDEMDARLMPCRDTVVVATYTGVYRPDWEAALAVARAILSPEAVTS